MKTVRCVDGRGRYVMDDTVKVRKKLSKSSAENNV